MDFAHLINLALHIGAGTAALAIGFIVLVRAKGSVVHRRLGQVFFGLSLLVCGSAAIGLAWFRFMPVFAVLTVLVAYQVVGGWRTARRKGRGPDWLDAVLTGIALLLALLLWPVLQVPGGAGVTVAIASFGALVFVLGYDALRWLFPHRWHAGLWRYEHAYKMVATLSGMLSALVGNVVRAGQPWSQLLPSALGVVAIGWCFHRILAEQRRERMPDRGCTGVGEVA